jgi:hypothetical protein
MDGTNGPKETKRVTAPVASNPLGVNVFSVRERLWSLSGLDSSARRSALTRSTRL